MEIFGILATTASLGITCVGLPAQIIKNYKLKSTKGISLGLMAPAFISYTLWSLYGWTKPDIFLKVAQTPGTLLVGIILYQYWIYRKNTT